MTPSIDELAAFCKKKGFVFKTAEIFGGLQGFYDYGPMGVELKNNVKKAFWNDFVTKNEFVVGIDGAIITNPQVWVASEHAEKFSDIMAKCSSCGFNVRVDTLIEDVTGKNVEGESLKEIGKIVKKEKIVCPKCKGILEEPNEFKLMFETNIGPEKNEKSTGYLRPETAQLIFAAFKNVYQTSRVKLPFGIAQVGKAFRNEISPRNFLFRLREFEQFEIEFFTNPEKLNDCPMYDGKAKVNIADKNSFKTVTVDSLLKKKVFASKWHAYWVTAFFNWFVKYGVKEKNLRLQPHSKDQLAHYANACVDIEYKFPFGWKELHGDADRGQFDLGQHQKVSKESLEVFDESVSKKVLPFVAAEPSQGIERALLVLLFDAYFDDKKRGNVVLKLNPLISPLKVAVLPLVKKDGLAEYAKEIFQNLQKRFNAFYDAGGSIGRRYARQDELGTPYCITVDYDSMKDKTVTVRDRDSTKQIRINVDELNTKIWEMIYLGKKFE